MTKDASPAVARSRCFMTVFCFGLGLVLLVVNWVGDELVGGLISLAILTAFGLLISLLTPHSEAIRGLTTRRDERFAQIDLRATAVAGLAVLGTLMVTWMVQVAQGHSGHPYDWLVAVSGVSYLLALAFFRWRG
jgi:uncharacterized YccA/Bax inhibitor family protein